MPVDFEEWVKVVYSGKQVESFKWLLTNNLSEKGANTCSPSTHEAETGGSLWIWGHHGIQCATHAKVSPHSNNENKGNI